MSVLQISHDLALPHDSAAAAEAHALELLTLYKHSLTLCQGLDPKEKAPGDDLIPLALATLMAARNLDMTTNSKSCHGENSNVEQQKLVQRRILQVLQIVLACLLAVQAVIPAAMAVFGGPIDEHPAYALPRQSNRALTM